MARNASGTYTLPGGNPVVSGTAISSTWANSTLSDIGTELTDSLDRSGKGGMLAPLQLVDGLVANPALAFTNELGSGLYRAGAGDVRLAILGSDLLRFQSSLLTVGAAGVGTIQAGILTAAGTANQSLTLRGNRSAADAGTDFVATSLAARTAGNLLDVQNNGTSVFTIANAATVPAATATFAGQSLSLSSANGATILAGGSNVSLTLRGNRTGADAGADMVFNSQATRTAGLLADFQNNGSSKLTVTFEGSVDLANSPAPASTATGYVGKLHKKTVPVCWGNVLCTGANAGTVQNGFNIGSISIAGNILTVNYATALSAAANVLICIVGTNSRLIVPNSFGTTSFTMALKDTSGVNQNFALNDIAYFVMYGVP